MSINYRSGPDPDELTKYEKMVLSILQAAVQHHGTQYGAIHLVKSAAEIADALFVELYEEEEDHE